jgi:hypothetical protein
LKKTAILVIAASGDPVHRHYIETHWTELIRHTNRSVPHIDVFLLFEHDTDLRDYRNLGDNIIQDSNADLDLLCEPRYQHPGIPSILSKTLYALEQLQNSYDVFFRTNLSSIIRIGSFDEFVQNRDHIRYSGEFAWSDHLRQDLLHHHRVGPEKSIKSLKELEEYEGNTFLSGCGYFLNCAEAKSLVQRKDRIRFDIVDDVSIGLMFREHDVLRGFSLIVSPEQPVCDIMQVIHQSSACHIRLQHFPPDQAQDLWKELENCAIWE